MPYKSVSYYCYRVYLVRVPNEGANEEERSINIQFRFPPGYPAKDPLEYESVFISNQLHFISQNSSSLASWCCFWSIKPGALGVGNYFRGFSRSTYSGRNCENISASVRGRTVLLQWHCLQLLHWANWSATSDPISSYRSLCAVSLKSLPIIVTSGWRLSVCWNNPRRNSCGSKKCISGLCVRSSFWCLLQHFKYIPRNETLHDVSWFLSVLIWTFQMPQIAFQLPSLDFCFVWKPGPIFSFSAYLSQIFFLESYLDPENYHKLYFFEFKLTGRANVDAIWAIK